MIVLDGIALGLALKKIDPKGSPHIIRVLLGLLPLAGNKPVVSSDQPYGPGNAMRVRLTVPPAPRGATNDTLGRTVFVGVTIQL